MEGSLSLGRLAVTNWKYLTVVLFHIFRELYLSPWGNYHSFVFIMCHWKRGKHQWQLFPKLSLFILTIYMYPQQYFFLMISTLYTQSITKVGWDWTTHTKLKIKKCSKDSRGKEGRFRDCTGLGSQPVWTCSHAHFSLYWSLWQLHPQDRISKQVQKKKKRMRKVRIHYSKQSQNEVHKLMRQKTCVPSVFNKKKEHVSTHLTFSMPAPSYRTAFWSSNQISPWE